MDEMAFWRPTYFCYQNPSAWPVMRRMISDCSIATEAWATVQYTQFLLANIAFEDRTLSQQPPPVLPTRIDLSYCSWDKLEMGLIGLRYGWLILYVSAQIITAFVCDIESIFSGVIVIPQRRGEIKLLLIRVSIKTLKWRNNHIAQ